MEGSNWSLGALKEYMDRRFDTMSLAVTTASAALDSRLHDMNQWRTQLDDERHAYLTQNEYRSNHRLLEQRLEDLTKTAGIARDSIEDKLSIRLTKLENWQAKILGAMALVLLLLPTMTALTIYYISRGNGHMPSTVTVTVPTNLGH